MHVRVLFFGMLKDLAGKSADSLQLHDGSSVRELLSECEKRSPRIADSLSSLAVAVNQQYADIEKVLNDGDEVALLPPVSGGSSDSDKSGGRTRSSIVRAVIDSSGVVAALKQGEDGAVLVFEGIVRNQTRGRRTLYLDYDAY